MFVSKAPDGMQRSRNPNVDVDDVNYVNQVDDVCVVEGQNDNQQVRFIKWFSLNALECVKIFV